ncbi:MAG: amidohydrolase [Proteobacteria bacterium]|nr:amidohydrolase [Pseudomonadota bacterium]MBU1714317.1 amidohydrolase [Pseudomonadota bacterium]
MEHDLLIINAFFYDPTWPVPINKGFLSINNGLITGFGRMSELPAISARKTIEAENTLAMPGLINSHNHAAMTLFRGLADDLPLMIWLNEHIFPAEAQFVSEEMVYWCSKLAAAEMIMSGTTTVADGYFHEDQAAQAFADAGIRAIAAQGVIDFPAPGVPDPTKNVSSVADFINRWQDHELITPAVFCHSPYTCSAQTVKNAKDLAAKTSSRFFIHLAETEFEVRKSKEEYEVSPVKYLHQLGVLDESTVCVHSVWLDDEDLQILRDSGATVATCPESNMKLASGIAPLKEMLELGLTTGIGTDGCASNNNLDLFQEMNTCAKLHKVKNLDPTVLTAREVLKMATIGGAEVLGIAETTGSLEIGKRADLILLDLKAPHLTPFYKPESLLVYAAGGQDVTTVIINGKLIMENRQILSFDLTECMKQVDRLSKKITKPI